MRPGLTRRAATCSTSAPIPAALDGLDWLACYLATGKHLALYRSFGTVVALLMLAVPPIMALGFLGALARRSRIRCTRSAGAIRPWSGASRTSSPSSSCRSRSTRVSNGRATRCSAPGWTSRSGAATTSSSAPPPRCRSAPPRGDIEAAGVRRPRRLAALAPDRLADHAAPRLAELYQRDDLLYHATTLVFFSSFPAWQRRGDALYHANHFAGKTFNPFVAYPIVGAFIHGTVGIIAVFGAINLRRTRHMAPTERTRLTFRPQFLR